jgi:hypothetical protein
LSKNAYSNDGRQPERGDTARKLIPIRAVRHKGYPSQLFDEYAWNTLLHLFVALSENETTTEQDLISLSGTSLASGRKWLVLLLNDGKIADRGEDVAFTRSSVKHMRSFLDEAAAIHRLTEVDLT